MRGATIAALTFLLAAVAIPRVAGAKDAGAAESVEQFCARVDRVTKPTHLLDFLVKLDVIEKPEWAEAEKVYRRSSGDLGITSTSFNVPKIEEVECVVLMSRSGGDDNNPTITAITVQTKRELITYHLGEKGYSEKFRSERQRPDPVDQPAEKIDKPNRVPGSD